MRADLHMHAHKYACAFLNVFYSDGIPESLVESVGYLLKFLEKKDFFFAILSSSAVSRDDRSRMLNKLAVHCQLDGTVLKLLKKIIERGDSAIINLVLQQVIQVGMHRRGEECCDVISSHELSEDERKKIMNLLSKAMGSTLIPHFLVDSSLICGVKIRGESFIWEKSIARRLILMDRFIERGDLT